MRVIIFFDSTQHILHFQTSKKASDMKAIIWSIILCLGISASAAYANTQCAGERDARSLNGNVETHIQFVNHHPSDVFLYWINYDGERQFYQTIPSGEVRRQETFLTHPWVITDDEDKCLAIYYPDGQPRTIDMYPCGVRSRRCR